MMDLKTVLVEDTNLERQMPQQPGASSANWRSRAATWISLEVMCPVGTTGSFSEMATPADSAGISSEIDETMARTQESLSAAVLEGQDEPQREHSVEEIRLVDYLLSGIVSIDVIPPETAASLIRDFPEEFDASVVDVDGTLSELSVNDQQFIDYQSPPPSGNPSPVALTQSPPSDLRTGGTLEDDGDSADPISAGPVGIVSRSPLIESSALPAASVEDTEEWSFEEERYFFYLDYGLLVKPLAGVAPVVDPSSPPVPSISVKESGDDLDADWSFEEERYADYLDELSARPKPLADSRSPVSSGLLVDQVSRPLSATGFSEHQERLVTAAITTPVRANSEPASSIASSFPDSGSPVGDYMPLASAISFGQAEEEYEEVSFEEERLTDYLEKMPWLQVMGENRTLFGSDLIFSEFVPKVSSPEEHRWALYRLRSSDPEALAPTGRPPSVDQEEGSVMSTIDRNLPSDFVISPEECRYEYYELLSNAQFIDEFDDIDEYHSNRTPVGNRNIEFSVSNSISDSLRSSSSPLPAGAGTASRVEREERLNQDSTPTPTPVQRVVEYLPSPVASVTAVDLMAGTPGRREATTKADLARVTLASLLEYKAVVYVSLLASLAECVLVGFGRSSWSSRLPEIIVLAVSSGCWLLELVMVGAEMISQANRIAGSVSGFDLSGDEDGGVLTSANTPKTSNSSKVSIGFRHLLGMRHVLEGLLLAFGWLALFFIPPIASLRSFRVFCSISGFDLVWTGLHATAVDDSWLDIAVLSRQCTDFWNKVGGELLSRRGRGGVVILTIFFFTNYIVAVVFWLEQEHLGSLASVSDSCTTLPDCFATMIRLCLFNDAGLDYLSEVIHSGNGWLGALLLLNLCFCSLVLLNGLVGVFGLSFYLSPTITVEAGYDKKSLASRQKSAAALTGRMNRYEAGTDETELDMDVIRGLKADLESLRAIPLAITKIEAQLNNLLSAASVSAGKGPSPTHSLYMSANNNNDLQFQAPSNQSGTGAPWVSGGSPSAVSPFSSPSSQTQHPSDSKAPNLSKHWAGQSIGSIESMPSVESTNRPRLHSEDRPKKVAFSAL